MVLRSELIFPNSLKRKWSPKKVIDESLSSSPQIQVKNLWRIILEDQQKLNWLIDRHSSVDTRYLRVGTRVPPLIFTQIFFLIFFSRYTLWNILADWECWLLLLLADFRKEGSSLFDLYVCRYLCLCAIIS